MNSIALAPLVNVASSGLCEALKAHCCAMNYEADMSHWFSCNY
ncbi:hypothetical protein T08_6945 [Trichinella sp. T8]|nr:hypothetical protein T08_6945 [Trichinella sp. T8]